MHSRPYSVSRTHAQPDLHRKCRLQDSCNSARCAQHAHAHTTRAELCLNCKIARAVLSMRMHTPPRVSQLQDASMLLWAFKWGFGSDFVYAFAKANACCVELKIAQIARQTTTRRRARVCVYALAIQRWQHNPAPATAPQPIRINPGSMTAMNTFAKQRGPKNNKNHSPACLHVCWQKLKNTKKHRGLRKRT